MSKSKPSGLTGRVLLQIGVPLLSFILLIGLWQAKLFHTIFNIKLHQLPLPLSIWQALVDNWSTLMFYTKYTVGEAIFGILIGSVIGFLFATIAVIWPKWGAGGLLLVAALNAVPIIALAPIMNLWFGDGLGSRVSIVTITTIAAMALNAHKGLRNVDPLALDLMHSYASGSYAIFWRLRLPNSLPHLFTALKINTTAGMIGAIVSEFFFSSKGLGYMLSNSLKIAQMSVGWACIVLSAIAGVLLYFIVQLLESLCIRWHVSQRT